jgi:hypothetical protein
VNNVATKGSKILAEQLKRLAIQSFTAGNLKATGPDFTINYLSEKGNKAQLVKALETFAASGAWVLALTSGESGTKGAAGSLIEEEMRERKQHEKEKTQTISNHPKIKTLQKVFAGSTIENIKIRE